MSMIKEINGGITAPKGFKATGGHVGIKKAKKDLCLVQSDVPAELGACFTTNRVKAAPVLWGIRINESGGKVKGFVVNSGNANACTGQRGIDDNYKIADAFAKEAGVCAEEILVCSTGVIGVMMPVEKIENGIKDLYKTLGYGGKNAFNAAEAIMTTDTFMKAIAVEVEIGGKNVRLGAMAKGSGMIHPNMATMLSFITTDVAISKEMLSKALKDSTEQTYNMISVDGDTSTNDTLFILANGLAGNEKIIDESKDYFVFKEAVDYINKKLAIDIAADGEGATKLMQVSVSGAKTKEDAKKIAKSVVSSSLFKSALFGADANWGRAACAMGYSGAEFDENNIGIAFASETESGILERIVLSEQSIPVAFDEDEAKKILSRKRIYVDITLNDGEFDAVAWGCDLTYDYVKINGDYRS